MSGLFELEYETAPLWLLAGVFLLGMMLAREAGAWVRRRRPPGAEEDDAEGFLIGAVLSLLGLLIAFTFSMALQRYDTRRELVTREANALGTAWLRTDLLDAPDRDRVRMALRAYVDARIAFGKARNREEEVRAQRNSEALQARLWQATMQAVAPFRTTELAPLIVSTTNDAIDVAGERFASRRAHVPPRIFRLLAVYALVAAAMVGYQRAPHRKATTLMFVLLALAVSLVIDLDRPASGSITVSQAPMLDLQRSLAR